MPSLTTSLSSITPSTWVSRATASGVDPWRAIRSSSASSCGGAWPPVLGDPAHHRVARALAQARAVDVDAAHARLRGEGDEARVQRRRGRARGCRTAWRARRSSGPRASRRRATRTARPRPARPPARRASGRSAAAWRLPSVIVPVLSSSSTSTSPEASTARPGQREHVAAHEPVHAGDPDRAQQRADRGRDERHEQRDQHRDGDVRAGVLAERAQRHDDDEEHDRQAGEQDRQRDLVRRLAPRGALDERDHAVEERLARAPG